MRKYARILGILFQTYGFKFRFLIIPIYRFFFYGFTISMMFLDDIFYPAHRRVVLDKPIFIVGHPRSGTTFLNRFLLDHYCASRGVLLWEMIFPSIIARKLVKPIVTRLKSKGGFYDAKIHDTNLFAAETSDAAIFFRYFHGLFAWLFFDGWQEFRDKQALYDSLRRVIINDNYIKHLKTLYQRLFLGEKRRLITKSFSAIFDVNQIRAAFPDAKIILMVRDPKEAVPSSMSLERSVQDGLLGFNKLDQAKKMKYYANLYQASQIFYEKQQEQFESGVIGSDNAFIVTHKALHDDFKNVMQQMVTYCELADSAELHAAIEKQAEKQSSQKSEHQYSLEEFGLSETQIEQDFDFAYKTFDL
jgi:hypothetical protein